MRHTPTLSLLLPLLSHSFTKHSFTTFHPPSRTHPRCHKQSSPHHSNPIPTTRSILYSTPPPPPSPDFDDFASPSEDNEADACRDLASEFYRQARVREDQQQQQDEGRLTTPSNRIEDDDDVVDDTRRPPPSQLSTTELESFLKKTSSFNLDSLASSSFEDDDDEPIQQPKFTGRSNTNTNTPPPPTSRRERDTSPLSPFPPTTSGSNGGRITPREQMMQSEFNLVSTFSSQSSLQFQFLLILLLSLIHI